MYAPRAFRVDDPAELDAFVDAHPFALLISDADGGAPELSHLPVLREGADTLVCHLAAPNPHCERLAAGAATTVVFTGAHGYVSPRWYAAEHAVPTWNYTTVHVQVAAREITDADVLHEGMRAMVRRFEGDDARIEQIVDDATIQGMLRGIRGFRLTVLGRQGKFKLSQNRSAEDRAGVIDGLADGGLEDQLLAALMRARERRASSGA